MEVNLQSVQFESEEHPALVRTGTSQRQARGVGRRSLGGLHPQRPWSRSEGGVRLGPSSMLFGPNRFVVSQLRP